VSHHVNGSLICMHAANRAWEQEFRRHFGEAACCPVQTYDSVVLWRNKIPLRPRKTKATVTLLSLETRTIGKKMQPLDLLPPFEETRPGKPLPPTPQSPPYLHDWHLPTAPLTIAQFAFDSHFFSNPDSLFSQLDEQLSRNSQIEVEPVREEEITPE